MKHRATTAVLVALVLAGCNRPADAPAGPPADQGSAADAPVAQDGSTGRDVGVTAVDAALPGVTFRAQGNEPGWIAEVAFRDEPSMHVEVDYGSTKLDVAQANEDETGWSGTTSDGRQVVLRVERVECLDDMSGEKFEARTILSVAGKEYRGCGRFKSD